MGSPTDADSARTQRDKWWLDQRDELARLLAPHLKPNTTGEPWALRVAEKILLAGYERSASRIRTGDSA